MNSSNLSVYKNLKIIVTGSTGFKGAWLCFWLNLLGAKVIGIALKPEKDSILFHKLSLSKKINQIYLDINNFKKLNQEIKKIENINTNFINEKIVLHDFDYYFSNVIARASKTMTDCHNEKIKLKKTGTDG